MSIVRLSVSRASHFRLILVALVLLQVFLGVRSYAESYEATDFTGSGLDTANTWTTNGLWRFMTQYPAAGKNGLIKWGNASGGQVAVLTKTLPVGKYKITLKDVMKNPDASPLSLGLTIQSVSQTVTANHTGTSLQDYILPGHFDVVDDGIADGEGTLTIQVGDALSFTQDWIGFSGFEITEDYNLGIDSFGSISGTDAQGNWSTDTNIPANWRKMNNYPVAGKTSLIKWGNGYLSTAAAFSIPLPAGRYKLIAKDVFKNQSNSQPVFHFKIQASDKTITATYTDVWVRDYNIPGEFEVTDADGDGFGTLSIEIGEAFSGTTDWMGISGFEARRMTKGLAWVRNHPFTIMGSVQNLKNTDNPETSINDGDTETSRLYKGANMSAFLNWDPQGEHILRANETDYFLPWFMRAEAVSPLTWVDLHSKHATWGKDNVHGGLLGWFIRDEPLMADFETVKDEAAWYRDTFPKALVMTTMGGEFGAEPTAYAAGMADTVGSDVLIYDAYPYKADQTVNVFPYMTAVRAAALSRGLPYWAWIQSYSRVGDEYLRMPSESELRREVFAHLTYGFTGISYFTFTPDASAEAMLTNAIDGQPTSIYNYIQEVNKEISILGKTLKHLKSLEVLFVPGREDPVVSNSPLNEPPTGLYNWVPNSGADVYIQSIAIDYSTIPNGNDSASLNTRTLLTATGKDCNGLIGFFEDPDGNLYFMLTNLRRYSDFSAADLPLTFKITFASSNANPPIVQKLNRATGLAEPVSLPSEGLNQWSTFITLDGGTGDLFKYKEGPFIGQ